MERAFPRLVAMHATCYFGFLGNAVFYTGGYLKRRDRSLIRSQFVSSCALTAAFWAAAMMDLDAPMLGHRLIVLDTLRATMLSFVSMRELVVLCAHLRRGGVDGVEASARFSAGETWEYSVGCVLSAIKLSVRPLDHVPLIIA